MTKAATPPTEEKGQSTALWFGVLGGPIAWIVHVVFGYILEDTACSPASGSEAILGIGIVPLFSMMTAVLAAVTALAGAVAYRCLGRMQGGTGTVAEQRARWMARAGIIVSVLFFVIIVFAFASFAILSVCEVSL